MTPATNSIGIIYLDMNGMLVFTTTTPSVVQFPFPTDIIRDLEIINKELLLKEVTELFMTNAIPPTRFIVVLSPNLLFEKSFQNAREPEQQKEIEQFLDNIPFEHVGTIIFENAESKFIAANKDFYSSIVKTLFQQNCMVEYILPAYVLGMDVNQALAMNHQLLSELHRKASSLRQYSFLVDDSLHPQQKKEMSAKPNEATKELLQREQQASQGENPKKRLFLLIGVFAFLLIILAVVAFTSLRPS